MNQVTLPKIEYEQLKRQAEVYRAFTAKFFEITARDPIDEVVEDFRQTNLYSEEFLSDLEAGLKKSSYSKFYDHQTTGRRSGSLLKKSRTHSKMAKGQTSVRK